MANDERDIEYAKQFLLKDHIKSKSETKYNYNTKTNEIIKRKIKHKQVYYIQIYFTCYGIVY